MQEVLRCQELLATTEVGRLRMLVPRLRFIAEGRTFLQRAARVDAAMADIDFFLRKHFNFLMEKQIGEKHEKDDVVWRTSGWGVVRQPQPISPNKNVVVYWRTQGQVAKMKAAGFLVNVSKAGCRYRDLKKMIEELQESFTTDTVH